MVFRVLLLLPCNSGAEVGDYFRGHYWRVAANRRRGLGVKFMLGAIDCIPVFCKGENDAVVLETEMERVRGNNVYPSMERLKDKIDELARAIANGLMRVGKDYDKIYILLNVKAYALATRLAIERLLPESVKQKIEFRYVPGNPARFTRLIVDTIDEIARLSMLARNEACLS